MALYSEDFESGTTDMTVSGSYSGVVSDYPITGTYSGSVGGDGETMTSPTMNVSGDATFEYALMKEANRNIAESGDSVRVEYYTDTGSWALLVEHFGSEFASNVPQTFSQSIPSNGQHSGFRFRFNSSGTAGPYDYWYFDDLLVELAYGVTTDAVSTLSFDSVTLNATATVAGSTDVWFTWGESGTSMPNTTATQTITASGSVTQALTGLSSRTEYEAQAFIDDGTTQASGSVVTFTTQSETPVGLTWTPSADAHENERVYRSSVASPAFPADYAQLSELGASTGSYDDYDAPENTSLTYAVVAVNVAGESVETTVSITTPAPSGGSVTESVDASTEAATTLVSAGAATSVSNTSSASSLATSTAPVGPVTTSVDAGGVTVSATSTVLPGGVTSVNTESVTASPVAAVGVATAGSTTSIGDTSSASGVGTSYVSPGVATTSADATGVSPLGSSLTVPGTATGPTVAELSGDTISAPSVTLASPVVSVSSVSAGSVSTASVSLGGSAVGVSSVSASSGLSTGVIPSNTTSDSEILAGLPAISSGQTLGSSVSAASVVDSGLSTVESVGIGADSASVAQIGGMTVISADSAPVGQISAISAVSAPISAGQSVILPAEAYLNLFLRVSEGGEKVAVVPIIERTVDVDLPGRVFEPL